MQPIEHPAIKKTWVSHDGNVVLYCADCLELLPHLPKVDLVVADPPYGLGKRLHDGGTWSTNPIYDAMLEWDTNDLPSTDDILRVIQAGENAIVWGGNYYALPPSRCWFIWRKQNKMPTLADFEMAWTSFDKNAREFTEISNPDGKRSHPTQKPISLMAWCVTRYPSGENKTVLDPFMGSGTTGVACVRTGRKFIGIEIDETYFDIAVKRIDAETRQTKLFP